MLNDNLTYKEIPISTDIGLTGFYNKEIAKSIRLIGQITTDLTADTDYTLLTLQQDYKPRVAVSKQIILSGTDKIICTFNITNGGLVQIIPKETVPSGRWISIYEAFI